MTDVRYRFLIVSVALAAAAVFPVMLSPLPAQAPTGVRPYVPPGTTDGQPDLQGVWRPWNLARHDLEDHGARPGVPAGRGFVVDPPNNQTRDADMSRTA